MIISLLIHIHVPYTANATYPNQFADRRTELVSRLRMVGM